MRRFWQLTTIIAVSALTVPFVLSAKSANAQQRMNGSYVGIGLVTGSGGSAGALTGRIDLKSVSIRPTIIRDCEGDLCATLFTPTVTYDFGLNQNANIYAGVGGSAASLSGGGESYSAGTGVVLQAGAEGTVSKNIALYGDLTYFTDGGASLWKFGGAYKF